MPEEEPGRGAAASSERRVYESNLLQYYKNRIVEHLGLNLTEDGAVVRPNGTSSKRPPPHGVDVIDSGTPINITIDGTMGE